MARRGARVVVADVNRDGAAALADELTGEGHTVMAVELDLADEGSIRELFDTGVARFGRIDILDNNATLCSPEDAAVADMDIKVWDNTFAVNARGCLLACQHALRSMLPNGGGAIVNMSSNSSLLGDVARTAYAASKAAINALTMYIATQYGPQGVRCNAVSPGLTLSAAVNTLIPAEAQQIFDRHTLTPYLGTPEHLAEVVAFLASEAAAYVTGQVITVDGGLLSHQPQAIDFRGKFGGFGDVHADIQA